MLYAKRYLTGLILLPQTALDNLLQYTILRGEVPGEMSSNSGLVKGIHEETDAAESEVWSHVHELLQIMAPKDDLLLYQNLL